jgi:hypothetical protein
MEAARRRKNDLEHRFHKVDMLLMTLFRLQRYDALLDHSRDDALAIGALCICKITLSG